MIKPLFNRDPNVVGHPECEGPALTDEMVTAAERELGVALPESYVSLMRNCNGGYTNDAAIGTSEPTSWDPTHVPVDVVFGIPAVGDQGRFGTGQGVLQTDYMTQEWGLPQGLVLLNGDGHWWIALDYRNSGAADPTVVWLDVESGQDLQLADSFDAFINALEPTTAFL